MLPTHTSKSVMLNMLKCEDKEYYSELQLWRHMRKEYNVDVRLAPNGQDSHGHMYYCMSCTSGYKDHKSFDSEQAITDHVRDVHSKHIEL